MNRGCNDWDEQRYFRHDAIRGSAKLRDAILKHLGTAKPVVWFTPVGVTPMLKKPAAPKTRPVPKSLRSRRRGRPPEPFRINPDIERIKQAVARHFKIDPIWMVDHNSCWSVARPRMIAMYVSRTVVGASFPVIGKHFAKDHTTVLHACRAVSSRPQLLDVAQEIARSLCPNEERLAA